MRPGADMGSMLGEASQPALPAAETPTPERIGFRVIDFEEAARILRRRRAILCARRRADRRNPDGHAA